MFPLTLTAAALVILLYGVAWHDEPARPAVIERRTRPTSRRPLARQVRSPRLVMRKSYGTPEHRILGRAKHEEDVVSGDQQASLRRNEN